MRTVLRMLLVSGLLVVALAAALPVMAQGGATPIAYGETATGEITNDAPEVYFMFSGRAGDMIVIGMNAVQQGLDSYVELQNAAGESLATDDDSGGNLNSLLGPFVLPADGNYTIKATRFGGRDGGSTGAFTLAVRPVSAVPLTLRETISVELNADQPVAFFSYEGHAGESLTLSVQGRGGTTDFNVNARDAAGATFNGVYVTANGQGLIDPLSLTADGTTFFLATRQIQPAMDDFAAVEISLTLSPIETVLITRDSAVEGTLNDTNPSDHLTFEAAAGELLRVEGAVPDPADQAIDVQVISPNGVSIGGGGTAYSDQPGTFVIDPMPVNTTGQYLLVIRRTDMTGQGAQGTSRYTVTVSASQVPALTLGEELTGTFSGQSPYDKVYRFEGVAGQTVRITLRSLDDHYGPSMDVQGPGYGDPAYAIYGGEGTSFIMNLNSPLPSTMRYEVALPVTGTYIFRVRNGAYYDPSVTPAVEAVYGLLVEAVE